MKCDCLRHCHFLYIDSSKLHCTRTRYGSATGIQNSSATTLVEALLNIIRFDERLCVSVCLSVFCVRGTVGHQMSGAPIAIVIGATAHRLTGVSRLARGHAYYSRLKRCATTLSCVRRDSARRVWPSTNCKITSRDAFSPRTLGPASLLLAALVALFYLDLSPAAPWPCIIKRTAPPSQRMLHDRPRPSHFTL